MTTTFDAATVKKIRQVADLIAEGNRVVGLEGATRTALLGQARTIVVQQNAYDEFVRQHDLLMPLIESVATKKT
jgi:hypothetical protein